MIRGGEEEEGEEEQEEEEGFSSLTGCDIRLMKIGGCIHRCEVGRPGQVMLGEGLTSHLSVTFSCVVVC